MKPMIYKPFVALLLAICMMMALCCLLNRLSVSADAPFSWQMWNPLEMGKGILFFLSFGFGFPVWLSAVCTLGMFGCGVWLFYVIIFRFIARF